MVITDKKIDLFDLIDKDFLQELQDNFSKLTNMASVTVNEDGFVTTPSNFCNFCSEMKNNEESNKHCSKCDLERIQIGFKNKKTFLYKCHAGLTNFVVPIVINDKTIALMVGGQTFIDEPDLNFYKQLANDFGLNEKEYLSNVKKVKKSSTEKVETAAKLLFQISNSISNAAHQNYVLAEKNKRENLTREIIKKIRSTLDKEETKKFFIETVCEYFDADRCLYVDYNKKTNKFYPFRLEKLKKSELKSLADVDVEKEFPEFSAKIKLGKNIIIRDVEKTLSNKHACSFKSVFSLENSDVKSDYGLLVKYRGEIMGCLILHFIVNKRNLTHDEFDFLKTIIEHAGTALYQAELYTKIKSQAEREALLKNVVTAVISTTNMDEAEMKIIELIGKTFRSDRCFIMEYNKKNDNYLTISNEYTSSDSVPSYIGINLNEEVPAFIAELKEGKKLVLGEQEAKINGNASIDLNNGNFESEKTTMMQYNVKSALVFPLKYSDQLLGDLVLHYSSDKVPLSDDEISFLESMANQIAITLHQTKLYHEIQLQSEREKISRNIIEIMRSSLDKNIIKKLFVKNIGKFFHANRVFIADYVEKNKTFLPVDEEIEYLSSSNLKSFTGVDWATPAYSNYAQKLMEKREVIISDVEDYIKNNNLPPEQIELFREGDVKSSYSFPITHQDRLLGSFSLEFTNTVVLLSDEDINRLRSICTQAGIALYQAELYFNAQEILDSKSKMINTVKNEIIQPVNSIIENANELSEGLLEIEQKKCLDVITSSCEQLIILTKNLQNG